MARVEKAGSTWWGEQRLAAGESAVWRIGPLLLGVLRGKCEWQVAYDWDLALEESQEWELHRGEELPEAAANQERFVVGETGDRIRLQPVLADRAVISCPRVPIHLLPERQITLYVGSPVWVRIEAGSPPVTLLELPSQRPSDTWFGGSTREGMLCYATKTRGLLNLEKLPVVPRVAVTPVHIDNQAPDALRLEKLKLPVPLLSLFCASDARLWTEGVVLTRSEESEMASLDIRSGPPPEVAGAELLSSAREAAESNLLIRAFSSLFGERPGKEE